MKTIQEELVALVHQEIDEIDQHYAKSKKMGRYRKEHFEDSQNTALMNPHTKFSYTAQLSRPDSTFLAVNLRMVRFKRVNLGVKTITGLDLDIQSALLNTCTTG
jgi:hypothetical protein